MPTTVVLVDGFNLYHALDSFQGGRFRRYKWISLRKLAEQFVFGREVLGEVLYFTTLSTWDANKTARHKLFIRAQENEGVKVIYGEFKRKERKCRRCKQEFWSFEEKQTDVNIALNLSRWLSRTVMTGPS